MLQELVDVGGKRVFASAGVAVPLEQLFIADGRVMEIDGEEHVVAREEEVFEGEDRAVLQRQVHAAVALDCLQVLHQPVEVELPVVHAAEERIPLQVIHPVRVQLAADHLAQDGQQIALAAAEWTRARRWSSAQK